MREILLTVGDELDRVAASPRRHIEDVALARAGRRRGPGARRACARAGRRGRRRHAARRFSHTFSPWSRSHLLSIEGPTVSYLVPPRTVGE